MSSSYTFSLYAWHLTLLLIMTFDTIQDRDRLPLWYLNHGFPVAFWRRQANKREGQSQNWTTSHGQHTERKTTSLAWTSDANGSPAHTTASIVLWGTRIQERTRSTTNELEEHTQPRPTKDEAQLGGSRGGSSWQTQMASMCGPMWIKVKDSEEKKIGQSPKWTWPKSRYQICKPMPVQSSYFHIP